MMATRLKTYASLSRHIHTNGVKAKLVGNGYMQVLAADVPIAE